ncbi:MAG: RNA-binding protein [Candidatus Lokiarchaeota archaeon]|nr:RNA-binding protein [Candidatus Lokiarchaeota archaeon]MBD3202355.1 RNA-binding protein [Candidatus Lokiarchaeota archaeon]
MKETLKNNDIVLTGQYLGVVEEFLPEKNSTFVKEGKIYATKAGLVKIDDEKREIEILTHQEKDRKVPVVGDIVIGTILFLRRYSVGLNFYTINKKLHFNSYFFGNIHVSQISNRYIEKINDAFQITDIIRAKVSEEKTNEYDLSTVGKYLGVIHTDCSICGTALDKVGFDKLRCPMCGNMESRKLAADYRDVSYNLRY